MRSPLCWSASTRREKHVDSLSEAANAEEAFVAEAPFETLAKIALAGFFGRKPRSPLGVVSAAGWEKLAPLLGADKAGAMRWDRRYAPWRGPVLFTALRLFLGRFGEARARFEAKVFEGALPAFPRQNPGGARRFRNGAGLGPLRWSWPCLRRGSSVQVCPESFA